MADPSARAAWRGPLARLGVALRELDQAAARARELHPGYDAGPAVAFIVGALCLTFMEYTMSPRVFAQVYRALAGLWEALPAYEMLRGSRWFALTDLSFWVLTRALGFVLFPALAARLLLRQRVRDYGLGLPQRWADLRLYLGLFVLMLPLLVLASSQPDFVSYYPFYRRAGESWLDLLSWELLYAFQFFCVELFFRGFLLRACFRSLGSHALYAAMVPYCMVHFSKPLPEVLGAIPAGLALGLLALRTGSLWGGVLLHVAVAWTMDALAIAQTTGFPTTLWPR